MNIRIHQIYYDNQSKSNCFPENNIFKPYFNQNCTKYFENSVIQKLLNNNEHLNYDYFGVVSHKFLKSRVKGKAIGFNNDTLLKRLQGVEILTFFKHIRGGGQIFHNNDRNHYAKIYNELMEHLHLNFRENMKPRECILQNHFIARSDIYDRYKPVLNDAIEFLESNQDANRITKYKGYTFHTFILERLIQAFVHHNKIKVISW